MRGLEILRAAIIFQDAAEHQSAKMNDHALPAEELRFVLEFESKPDLTQISEKLHELIGNDCFVLKDLFVTSTDDLSRYITLRFPGMKRTFSRQTLFSIAYDLSDLLKTFRVEPDLGAEIYADPEKHYEGPHVESADMINRLCWVDAPPPSEQDWALRNINAIAAWDQSKSQGEGIIVGQPDTGIADHTEIQTSSLMLNLSTDILDGDADPEDPLLADTANPGHGTGTASVIIGQNGTKKLGAAPKAKLVPIRCTQDVKIIDGASLAAAIEHATRSGCHIITMSLGGLPSSAVHAAVKHAIESGVIVLAAAGNCVRVVVYPARYDEVIAVGGTNISDDPWQGTSRGSEVTISAPAELVWRAQRKPNDDNKSLVTAGQGTSFAVALTAGVAALWLSHHTRERVLAEAQKRGTSVQNLFRAALQSSSRTPPGWDAGSFGAGIVDAAQLLATSLDTIHTGTPELVSSAPAAHVQKLLTEIAGPGPRDSTFDWTRYGLEIASILFEDARFGRRSIGPSAEIQALRASPSPDLRREAGYSQDHRLRSIATRAAQRGAQAAAQVNKLKAKASESDTISFMTQVTPNRRTSIGSVTAEHDRLLKILGSQPEKRTEATAATSLEAARDNLRSGGAEARIAEANRVLDVITAREFRPNPIIKALRQRIIRNGPALLHSLSSIDPKALSFADRVTAESLVLLTERPALRVLDGKINLDDELVGSWQSQIALGEKDLNSAFLSVGRIDAGGEHIGTGFVVANGLIMTNRHVVQAFAAPIPRASSPTAWILEQPDVTIDFSDKPPSQRKSFRIKKIVETSSDNINPRLIDLKRLDMALLEVEERNEAGEQLPEPLALITDTAVLNSKSRLYLIGFPASPNDLPTDQANRPRSDIVERLRQIYGHRYGVKYLSPGYVSDILGQTPLDDPYDWTFGHDATTLGGNSGSCILSLDDPVGVVGLHFAGDWLRQNYGFGLPAVSKQEAAKALTKIIWP